MKVIVLVEKLKEGVFIASRLCQKSVNLPILDNFLIETEGNFLKLTSTNLEIGIKFWILAKIEKKGKIAIPAKTFFQLLSYLKEEKVLLLSEKNVLKIKTERLKTKILGQDPQDYPIVPKVEKIFCEVSLSEFIDALCQVVDFTCPTQIRPELSGVWISFSGQNITLAASDSFRLAEKKIYFEGKCDKDFSFILPQRAAKELINSFAEKEGNLKIYLSQNQVMFEKDFLELNHPQVQITSRLIEGSFPEYQKIIPSQFETEISLQKNEFLEKIKSAGIFAPKINEIQIQVFPQKGKIELFSENSELGEIRLNLPAKIKGKELEISFNHKFLAEGLSKIKTPQVNFFLSSKEGPALLKPSDKEDYLYIVMPIKPS